jgi:uncharacterized protein
MIPQDLSTYRQLLARLDAHSERVSSAWADALSCAEGCSGCCLRDLSVFAVEAANIRAWLADNDLGSGTSAEGCALLDERGRCRIYPVRPVVCRTHGLPLAVAQDDGTVTGDVCPLNFDGGEGLAQVPSQDFLSVTTIDTMLAAVDLAFTRSAGLPDGQRTPLADLADRGGETS